MGDQRYLKACLYNSRLSKVTAIQNTTLLFGPGRPIIDIQGVSKNLPNPAHTRRLFWIHLLDVQGVGTYLFIDFLFLIAYDF